MSLHRLERRPPNQWLLALGTCLFAQVASAAPDELGVPYGVRADPRPVPPGLLSDAEPPPQSAAAKSNVFFLNYDGVTIQYTGQQDDSSQNVSQFQDFAMTYQPYGAGAKRAASMQAVKSDWAKYKVVITDQRPANGSYTMCVNSPTNPFGGGVLGIAPLDCNDQQGRNIVFAYHSANDQFPAATQATTISQEIAHAFGVEHVKEPNDVMNPYNAGGDPSFLDKCLTLDGGGMGIICNQQHDQFCGGGGQNSHQELVWLFGLSEPDPQAPAVNITFPTNGQVFPPGSDFTIVAEASDNVGVVGVEIFLDGQPTVYDQSSPYTQGLQGVPVGTYSVYAVATDESMNTSQSATITFTVESDSPEPPATTEPPDPTTDPTADPTANPPTTSDSDGDSASSTATEGDSASASAGDEGSSGFEGGLEGGIPGGPALPPGYGQDGEGGCSVAPRAVPSAGLLMLALLGLGRRRRT